MDESKPTYNYDLHPDEIHSETPVSGNQPNQFDTKTILKHLGLFLATFLTVSIFGALFVGQSANVESFWPMLLDGALFAILLLGFLGTHEFGHFFAAVYHKIKVSLPYFIPVPLGIGTLGAVIRIKQKINDTYKMFDIGIAGPLAGFAVSLIVLLYGFFTLPGPEYINNFGGHDAVQQYVAENGTFPDEPPEGNSEEVLIVGNTLLYSFLAGFFEHVPPMWEMYHYPFLWAGWLGLFFTALNLMPMGQLDGGHILYSLIGYRKHRTVARICFTILTILAGIESVPAVHHWLGSWDNSLGTVSWITWAGVLFLLLRKAFHSDHRWIAPVMAISLGITAGYLFLVVGNLETSGSLIWIFWSFFIAYLVKIEHPPALYERPLSTPRKILGWFSMAIFILCISPNPLYFI